RTTALKVHRCTGRAGSICICGWVRCDTVLHLAEGSVLNSYWIGDSYHAPPPLTVRYLSRSFRRPWKVTMPSITPVELNIRSTRLESRPGEKRCRYSRTAAYRMSESVILNRL